MPHSKLARIMKTNLLIPYCALLVGFLAGESLMTYDAVRGIRAVAAASKVSTSQKWSDLASPSSSTTWNIPAPAWRDRSDLNPLSNKVTILVGPGKEVIVTFLDLPKSEMVSMISNMFSNGKPEVEKRFAKLLDESPNITLTITTKEK